jgi:sulfate adenylyltransferase subunit 2
MASTLSTHLQRLEAESIYIIREVAAEFANPVMMYSIGKDSAVMLHLAMKAFYPANLEVPGDDHLPRRDGEAPRHRADRACE